MSAPSGAPSPAPRSGSIGPGGGMNMPPSQGMNGVVPMGPNPPMSGGAGAGAGGSTGGPAPSMSQQNLNQIVIDYLAKKGYSRTEAMLRMESANQEALASSLNPQSHTTPPNYERIFGITQKWIEETLNIYRPELRRILWPVFVYSYLILVTQNRSADAENFFNNFKGLFAQEHSEDLRMLGPIKSSEHVEDSYIAQLYYKNRYRLSISEPAFYHLVQFLESQKEYGGILLLDILNGHCNIATVNRASDDRYSFAAILARGNEVQDMPAEDEGIPGHHPGSTYTGDRPGVGQTLAKLKLGKMPMEETLEGDVRAELESLDAKEPPQPGRDTLVETHEMVNIKQEPDDEPPSRVEIPYPQSTARDVAMEVQKVRENRDRFKIESRTGGIGPGISVCMFTFHNTFDCVNCLDFSGDNQLVAAGTSESYIRVWSLDGKALPSITPNSQPSNSHRLIGHAGPVYAVKFGPSIASTSDDPTAPNTSTKWLLSSSADATIRLWNLDIWQQVVIYKGHIGPVWDLSWGPFGHYFVSCGHDKTARLWTTDRIRQVRIFAGHEDGVDVVAYHPNSAYVFTGSSDKTVRMWAITTGNPVRMFTGHTGAVTALACSPSGKILASADDQGSIILWDLAAGKLIRRSRGHAKGGIWSLSFSVESTVLVSGGADGTVRVWDVVGPGKEHPSGLQGKVIGEGGAGQKIDGAGGASGGTSASTGQVSAGAGVGALTGGAAGGKKKGKDVVVTPDQISAFPTKKSPVYNVRFTGMNLVVAGGAYMP